MKKLFLLIVGLLGFATAQAALTALHIHTVSNGVITVLLDNEPILQFNNDRSITITVSDQTGQDLIRLDFDDIKKCEYGDKDDYTLNEVNDIVQDLTPAITVSIVGGDITFGNLPDCAEIEIYNLGGKRVFNTSGVGSTYRLDRSGLSHGIYIVRIGFFVTKLSL